MDGVWNGDNFVAVVGNPVRLNGLYVQYDGGWVEVAKIVPQQRLSFCSDRGDLVQWENTDEQTFHTRGSGTVDAGTD
jgi:hypothetical protein